MAIENIKNYFNSEANNFFHFILVGDENYKTILDQVTGMQYTIIKVSDYCTNDDKIPDLDKLLNDLENVSSNSILIGLAECLSLQGGNEAKNYLSRLKYKPLNGGKVVILLYGLHYIIKDMMKDDIRFDNRHVTDCKESEPNVVLQVMKPPFLLPKTKLGIKNLLATFESTSEHTPISVQSSFDFSNSRYTIESVSSFYELLPSSISKFIDRTFSKEEFFEKLHNELEEHKQDINSLFTKHGFSMNENSFLFSSNNEHKNWLNFIYLKLNNDKTTNKYLQYIITKAEDFKSIKEMILNEIIEIPHTAEDFSTFYNERKSLVKNFHKSEIASFIVNNKKYEEECFYKLTDNSLIEKEEIISLLTKSKCSLDVANLYPDLAAYLSRYHFSSGALSETLTSYFDDYKKQKICNEIFPEFLEQVEEFSEKRPYNALKSRDEIFAGINTNSTFLSWVDALGVEYLSYIVYLAEKQGLHIEIKIARSDLPTITSINKSFYNNWAGEKETESRLDKLKHNNYLDYKHNKDDKDRSVAYLAHELDIIKEVINEAAVRLNSDSYKSVVVASDHGSSRLAVIHNKEEKYKTETGGEYSGRACKIFDGYENLPFYVKTDDYIVLADYGRFEGSRASLLEVHGGASLEEVIVPIITFTSKNADYKIQLVTEDIEASTKDGSKIELFSGKKVKDLSVHINEKKYLSQSEDDTHHKIHLTDVKKAGTYQARIYLGDVFITTIELKIHGKSARTNTDFDDLF